MERRELEQLIKEHHSIRRIAAARQVSYTTIRYWLRRLKLRKLNGMSITRIRRNRPRTGGKLQRSKQRVWATHQTRTIRTRQELLNQVFEILQGWSSG